MVSTPLPDIFRIPMLAGRWLRQALGRDAAPARPGPQLIYRLRAWPELDEDGRTAPVYRMLSLMSQRPLNRQWIIDHLHMAPAQVDAVLARLVAQGAVEVIDPAEFRAGQ